MVTRQTGKPAPCSRFPKCQCRMDRILHPNPQPSSGTQELAADRKTSNTKRPNTAATPTEDVRGVHVRCRRPSAQSCRHDIRLAVIFAYSVHRAEGTLEALSPNLCHTPASFAQEATRPPSPSHICALELTRAHRFPSMTPQLRPISQLQIWKAPLEPFEPLVRRNKICSAREMREMEKYEVAEDTKRVRSNVIWMRALRAVLRTVMATHYAPAAATRAVSACSWTAIIQADQLNKVNITGYVLQQSHTTGKARYNGCIGVRTLSPPALTPQAWPHLACGRSCRAARPPP